jgi:hypothetical protein
MIYPHQANRMTTLISIRNDIRQTIPRNRANSPSRAKYSTQCAVKLNNKLVNGHIN